MTRVSQLKPQKKSKGSPKTAKRLAIKKAMLATRAKKTIKKGK
jgi:hypothetical protein